MLSKRMQKIWESFSEEEKKAIDARYNILREEYMTLQEIRKNRHITQEDMAKLMGIAQENVSRTERRQDIRLSTLRDYVDALGGHIQINAIFPDNEVIPILQAHYFDSNNSGNL